LKLLTFFLTTAFAASSLLADDSTDTSSYPTIGNAQASVKVIALLEPKCPDSKRYNNTSFAKLKEEYIDTGKIAYSVVTTSFLPHSMPAAIALLCVYNHGGNDLFFKYLDYIYQNQPPERDDWATVATLQKFAAATSSEINQEKLKKCIESKDYQDQITKNTSYGRSLMDGHLSTPTIFVNGVKVENTDETIDYENLKNAIDSALSSDDLLEGL
jgi:protein-disulfide isomerase